MQGTQMPSVEKTALPLAVLSMVSSASLVELAADAIVTGISAGALRPGQRLVETDLANTLNMSKVPLLEALKILEAQGRALGSMTLHLARSYEPCTGAPERLRALRMSITLDADILVVRWSTMAFGDLLSGSSIDDSQSHCNSLDHGCSAHGTEPERRMVSGN
jgi:hypothetical protein